MKIIPNGVPVYIEKIRDIVTTMNLPYSETTYMKNQMLHIRGFNIGLLICLPTTDEGLTIFRIVHLCIVRKLCKDFLFFESNLAFIILNRNN